MSGEPTYYDRPLLKQPVWKLYIPTYYFTGGAAGSALVLGAAAQLLSAQAGGPLCAARKRSPELKGLIRRAHWTGIVGSSLGAALLILDLGRPMRFINMLRVFRPTSPMNMGAWILAGTPPAAITAALFGGAAGYASGMLGLGLSTYTGVLVANSAVPVWQESRRVLPLLFGASAMSAAGSILNCFDDNPRAMSIARNYAIAGGLGELAGSLAMERQASRVKRVARPLKHGFSGALWRTAGLLTAASVVTNLIPGRSKKKRVFAGVCGALGSLALRFAVHYAGEQSARDPRASFRVQRATTTGAPAVSPPVLA